MQNDNLKWISDASHGWLRVDKSNYIRSNFRASRYSYYDDEFVYLEEDCDAPGYINEHNITNYRTLPEDCYDGECFVRDLNNIYRAN